MQAMHEAYAGAACLAENAMLMLRLPRRQHHRPSMHFGRLHSHFKHNLRFMGCRTAETASRASCYFDPF